MITVPASEDPRLPEKKIFITHLQTGIWVPAMWCSVHDRHPSECWDVHYPEASSGER